LLLLLLKLMWVVFQLCPWRRTDCWFITLNQIILSIHFEIHKLSRFAQYTTREYQANIQPNQLLIYQLGVVIRAPLQGNCSLLSPFHLWQTNHPPKI
jgi:hypothetical protein